MRDRAGEAPDGSSDPSLPELARDITEALSRGVVPDDRIFDQFLPYEQRRVSSMFWTPAQVAWLVARWLDKRAVRTVLDIGSGTGKLCVIGALSCRATFVGIEQRPSLVQSAQRFAEHFALGDRVRFIVGEFGSSPTPAVDAYYLYNPFGENLFDDGERLGGAVELSVERFRRDARAVTRMLHAAPEGTLACTYNGFGGAIPRSYRLVELETDFACPLRLWEKQRGGIGWGELPEEG